MDYSRIGQELLYWCAVVFLLKNLFHSELKQSSPLERSISWDI
ncbi:unnamed protein product, partial [Musa acuminata var. zebrina]